MTITHEHIRAAGGIVHSDGNIFFTNLEKLNAAVLAAQPAPAQEFVCSTGLCHYKAAQPALCNPAQDGVCDALGCQCDTVPAPQQPPRFPTMLRKMWSGAEVQAWIDEHWHSAPAAAPTIPSGWSLTLDGQHIKLTSPEARWWDFGPNTDGPDRLVWEFLSAMRDGAPAQKGGA